MVQTSFTYLTVIPTSTTFPDLGLYILFFFNLHRCVSAMWVYAPSAGAPSAQNKVLEPLQLDLGLIVSCLMEMLETKLSSSARTVLSLNC